MRYLQNVGNSEKPNSHFCTSTLCVSLFASIYFQRRARCCWLCFVTLTLPPNPWNQWFLLSSPAMTLWPNEPLEPLFLTDTSSLALNSKQNGAVCHKLPLCAVLNTKYRNDKRGRVLPPPFVSYVLMAIIFSTCFLLITFHLLRRQYNFLPFRFKMKFEWKRIRWYLKRVIK